MTTPTNALSAEAITTAFSAAVGNTFEMFSALLPIGLTVFAAVWGVRKAMSFFKATTN